LLLRRSQAGIDPLAQLRVTGLVPTIQQVSLRILQHYRGRIGIELEIEQDAFRRCERTFMLGPAKCFKNPTYAPDFGLGS
jgi:hypothetical protein